MSKRIVMCRNAKLVPASLYWPGRVEPEALVLLAELVSEHPVLGTPSDGSDNRIRTSLVVKHDFVTGQVETLNTLYQVVA
jgi:hypothetical protein